MTQLTEYFSVIYKKIWSMTERKLGTLSALVRYQQVVSNAQMLL